VVGPDRKLVAILDPADLEAVVARVRQTSTETARHVAAR
jgi:hypothetical protein